MHRLTKYKKRLFNRLTRSVFDTQPLICDPNSRAIILSQSYHADLNMYLVAVKSFGRYLRPHHFVIVDDGLTTSDRELLREHLEVVEFIRTADVDVGACPRRGCWERLATIALQCKNYYVVQLDSDTVTRSIPHEVLQCVKEDRCYTLGTLHEGGVETVPALEASLIASRFQGEHVQLVAERALSKIASVESARYVRGCAGFAGFARGSFDPQALQDFSREMEALVGSAKWNEWGSEQFASNFIVANAPHAMVLPVESYMNWSPKRNWTAAKFLHFIGDFRFRGFTYAVESRRAIAM